MLAREKFTAKEWRRAFRKHSKLGYPSDDTPEEDQKKQQDAFIVEDQFEKEVSSPIKLEDNNSESESELKPSSFTDLQLFESANIREDKEY